MTEKQLKIRQLKKGENLSDLLEGEVIIIHEIRGVPPNKVKAVYLGRKKFYSYTEGENLFPYVFLSRQHESRLELHYLFNEEGKVVYDQWRTKEWASKYYYTFRDKGICDRGEEDFNCLNSLLIKNGL